MPTLDLRKTLKHLYNPSPREPALVDVPEFQFAMLDGAIEPGAEPGTSPAFAAALEALYGVSYTLKFMSKQRMSKQGAEEAVDYTVMPLEALWWIEEGEFDYQRKDNWCWRAMILQPDHITAEMFAQAVARLGKKHADNPAIPPLRLESFREGLAVQIMHLGPYSEEPATIARMNSFAAANGCRLHHMHHEIYLGDPRRTASAKLKTVLRHPVARVGKAPAQPLLCLGHAGYGVLSHSSRNSFTYCWASTPCHISLPSPLVQ